MTLRELLESFPDHVTVLDCEVVLSDLLPVVRAQLINNQIVLTDAAEACGCGCEDCVEEECHG